MPKSMYAIPGAPVPKPGSLAGRLTMKLITMVSTLRVESKAIMRM